MLENGAAPAVQATEVKTEERPLSPSEAHEAAQQTSFFGNTVEDSGETISGSDNSEVSKETMGLDGWLFTDGVEGTGPRPLWLKDKYKSVADQAAAYSELEKKLGEFKGAPKDGYKFEEADGLNLEDPMLAKFLPKFKEMNMSQEAVKTLINEWSDYQQSAVKIDVKEEIKKLGIEGHDMIAKTNQWMKNNLSPEVVETVQSWIHTAEDMKALNALRSFQPLSRSPTANDMQTSFTHESLAEVKNEKIKNWQKYQDDTNYRDTINSRMAAAVTRNDATKKR